MLTTRATLYLGSGLKHSLVCFRVKHDLDLALFLESYSKSIQVTIFFTHPAMIVFLAWIVRGEAVRWTGLLGVLLSMVGVVFVAKPPFLFGGAHWTPDHISGMLSNATAQASILFTATEGLPCFPLQALYICGPFRSIDILQLGEDMSTRVCSEDT